MNRLFKLRGELKANQTLVLSILGFIFIIATWHLLSVLGDTYEWKLKAVLPSPYEVLLAFKELVQKDELFKNACRSIGYNLSGYVIAVAISIPVGFLLGLIPFFRGLFQSPLNAIRFLPLPAAIGIFMAFFGLGTPLIVNFLAFGIFIYLVPVVVQRINEVDEVYLKTVYTLGANSWQTIKSVYFPSVISRLSDDIRILTALSWTYITVAEVIGSRGGIGALIWRIGDRFGRYDKVFALLIVIILIGVIQDRIFKYLDIKLFPHKYQTKNKHQKNSASFLNGIWDYLGMILMWLGIIIYLFLLINEYASIGGIKPMLDYLFGQTVWVIHLIMLGIIGFNVYTFFLKNKKNKT